MPIEDFLNDTKLCAPRPTERMPKDAPAILMRHMKGVKFTNESEVNEALVRPSFSLSQEVMLILFAFLS